MPDFRATVQIAAPADLIWTVVRDVERWAEWTPSIRDITLLDGAPLRLGSRARIRQPKLPTNLMTVTALEEGRGFTWESKSPGLRAIADHWIKDDPQGCQVTLAVRFEGWLAPLVAWLAGGLTRQYISWEAAGLKRRCEEWSGYGAGDAVC